MNGLTTVPLFKNLMVIFVFISLVASLGVLIIDHFYHIQSDPLIASWFLVGIGYCSSQLGNYQGAATANTAISSLQTMMQNILANQSLTPNIPPPAATPTTAEGSVKTNG